MKYLYSVSILMVYSMFICTGQIEDRQWLIVDGNGYNSTTQKYDVVFESKGVVINGISLPDKEEIRARDDIFIIYNKDSYYSSRYNLWWGERNEAGIPKSPNYNIAENEVKLAIASHESSSNFAYMYLTNVYDKDDPPEKVVLTDGTLGGSNQNFVGKSEHWWPLTANHDVVPGKDITLIVDLAADNMKNINKLRIAYHHIILDSKTKSITKESQTIRLPLDFPESLEFKPGLLSPSKVFGDFAYYPNSNRNIISATENIDSSFIDFVIAPIAHNENYDRPKFLFLNLKASEKVRDLFNENETNPYYDVVFSAGSFDPNNPHGGAFVAERSQPTHDPNVVGAKSICIDSNMIYFEGQFYNRTESLAEDLAFSFIVSPALDVNTLKFSFIKANAKQLRANDFTVNVQSDSVIVKLKDVGIKVRQTGINSLDTGRVEFGFCLKLKSTVELDSTEPYLLAIQNPKSYFFINSSNPQMYDMRYDDLPYGIFNIHEDILQHYVKYDNVCVACSLTPIIPKYNWWLIGACAILGILAAVYYFKRQLDKQRIASRT